MREEREVVHGGDRRGSGGESVKELRPHPGLRPSGESRGTGVAGASRGGRRENPTSQPTRLVAQLFFQPQQLVVLRETFAADN